MAFQGAKAQPCLGVSFPSKQDIPSTFHAALPCALNRLALIYTVFVNGMEGRFPGRKKTAFLKVMRNFSPEMFFSVQFLKK